MPHLKRILRNTALTAVALLLIAFTLVQFQQRLLRHRAEKLNADIAQLRNHPALGYQVVDRCIHFRKPL